MGACCSSHRTVCSVDLLEARRFIDAHCTVEPGVFTPGNACAVAFALYLRRNVTTEQRGVLGDEDLMEADVAREVCAAASELAIKHAVYPILSRLNSLRMVVGLRVDTVPV